MSIQELRDWLGEQDQPGVLWYVKRLSANDTQANGSHQAGPYVPKSLLFRLFPSIDSREAENPRVSFVADVDSDHVSLSVRAIYYNNKWRGGTRNEARITGWGGEASPLLDHESTGALTVFAFWVGQDGHDPRCHIWVAHNDVEEDVIQERTGPVEPGEWVTYPGLLSSFRGAASCRLAPEDIPPAWLTEFPKGDELVTKAVELRPETATEVDGRLMARRACEFEIYRSLEEAVYLPRIHEGFEGIDDLLEVTQSITQRRRSRGGRSLELHVKQILQEENMKFAWNPIVDANKRPDFVFPSVTAYGNAAFPASHLRMLAVKSTVRERWRQILEEADRIKTKHLLTLQEGVSESQFSAMQEAGVHLVVPEGLHDRYPKPVRPYLQTLESFIGEVRALQP